MPQRKVVFHEGGYYHIFNRGANRQKIFCSDENYRYLVRTMNRIKPEGISVLAFCLMPNHYHFLVRQEAEEPVHVFIQGLFNVYSKAFNKMFRRTGTLFEGRFRAVEITENRHLLHLCRYIHGNPVQAGLVHCAEDWPFSDYRDWVLKMQGTSRVPGNFLTENFQTPEEYRKFVEDWDGGVIEGLEAVMFDEKEQVQVPGTSKVPGT